MNSFFDAIKNDPVACREEAKLRIFSINVSPSDKELGIKLLNRAVTLCDAEASFIMGRLILDGLVKVRNNNPTDLALELLCGSARRGNTQARAYLNRYCQMRYQINVRNKISGTVNGPLTDFKGKRIRIDRKGVMTPVDATLTYENGENILRISTNLSWLLFEEMHCDEEKLKNAVCNGFCLWSGDYEVFGGQKLRVQVEVTEEPRCFDNVFILPITEDMRRDVLNIWGKFGNKTLTDRASKYFQSKRSAAGIGVTKWSVKTRKAIFLHSENNRFDDYEEIKHVAKHEFGHILGLGDLYWSPDDRLDGVEQGKYAEIDNYRIYDRFYNLVMCDHHAPVSNNDIEMVVLAFSKNRFQHFQPSKIKGEISEALGKGN